MLGYVVFVDGIKLDLKKCEVIKVILLLKNVLDFRLFFGMCGYVFKFILNYVNIVEFLWKLIWSEVKFLWGKE